MNTGDFVLPLCVKFYQVLVPFVLNWGEPEQAPHKYVYELYIYYYYGIPSPVLCCYICTLYAVRNIFQHNHESLKILLRVPCKGAASTRRLHEATLKEDDAIDQCVSVSESPEGMIGGFKGETALHASVETKIEVCTERQRRKVSARWRRPKSITDMK